MSRNPRGTQFLNLCATVYDKASLNDKQTQMLNKRGGELQDILKKAIEELSLKVPSLPHLIFALKLDWTNSDITEANFPVQKKDNDSPKKYKIFRFSTHTSSENAISCWMDRTL